MRSKVVRSNLSYLEDGSDRIYERLSRFLIPFENELTLDFTPLSSGIAQFNIYNSLGQAVSSRSIQLNAGQHIRTTLNFNLPSGYYFYSLNLGQRIIKSGKLNRS